ncbi:MAG TPA: class II aldolase/adducin family protein [Burkholderiaceae bacterium]|nr:class II aldolase/adducin family protein [Burkholderiaceae bacterium]
MSELRDDSLELREAVIATARAMNASGINVNKSGNVSVRCLRGARAGFLLTPTGVPYERLGADDLVFVGDDGRAIGRREPSSEWRFHAAIYQARRELHAVVHTHSTHATALACQGLGIPAFHYMVAVAGGHDIRCAEYATFGTQALADNALAALQDRKACLLAHHGVIACADSLDAALALAVEVENLARTYVVVRALGEPRLLDRVEMDRVLERFRTYGQAQRE